MNPRHGAIARWAIASAASVAAAAFGACSSSPPRFEPGPVVRRVDDGRDIARPGKTEFERISHHGHNFINRSIRLALDPLRAAPAGDVNRLGEVPTSSWYEIRRELTPDDVARGAGGRDPGPEAHKPWVIRGLKMGGRNPGFVFEDARGRSYICKFDKRDEPVVSTAAGAIAARLFWALGYLTPDDRVVYFAREDLRVGEGASVTPPNGHERAMTDRDVNDLLASSLVHRYGDRCRALVSRFLDGRPVGGYSYRGTRSDDPNDTVAHENRRSLRAMRVFAAWLNHVDVKIDNTLDLYAEQSGRHFIRHYLVDFDGCLGGYWAARHEQRIGWAYDFDVPEMVGGLATLGLRTRPYENLDRIPHAEVGLFEADVFDPSRWKANYANDQIEACNPADIFWAGTVMARLGPEDIRAACRAGRYEDPAAEAIVADILWRRREKTLDWALGRVTPVVSLAPLGGGAPGGSGGRGFRVAAADALVRSDRPSALRYDVALLTAGGERLAQWDDHESPDIDIAAELLDGHDYVVVRWTARGPRGNRLPPTEAHYARVSRSSPRAAGWDLLGILRDGE